jgi:hypothetical protein
MSDMSFFVLNMEIQVSYQITGRIKSSPIKLIARIVFYCKSITDSSASERDDVNTATSQNSFRSRSNPEMGVNAIVTQTSAELPTRVPMIDMQRRRVTVEDARAPQGSRSNDTRGR